MQESFQFLAEKAGRHVLQLIKLLRECMPARIALCAAVCAVLFPVLTVTDGLGDSSQAITAFSEGNTGKGDTSTPKSFMEIKGMKEVQEFHGLHNPFGEGNSQGRRPKDSKNRPGPAEGNMSGSAGARGKAGDTPKDKKAAERTMPHIRGVMAGKEGTAVLLEYGGNQYMLYPGEGTGDVTVENIEGNRVKLNVHGRELWAEK